MSGRFRVGTDLATRLHRLGYTRELGFHQFLYPSEPDTRAILKFLLDKMPKAADADNAAYSGGGKDDGARGRLDTATERAAAAVAASLRRGSGFQTNNKKKSSSSKTAGGAGAGAGAGGGFAALKGALKAGGGLAAVAAASAKDARRAAREARPFWTTPLTNPSAAAAASSSSPHLPAPPPPPPPFTSGAPRGYLPPSLLEYAAGSVVAAQMKAETQLARLAGLTNGGGGKGLGLGPGAAAGEGGGKGAFLLDADGEVVPCCPVSHSRFTFHA